MAPYALGLTLALALALSREAGGFPAPLRWEAHDGLGVHPCEQASPRGFLLDYEPGAYTVTRGSAKHGYVMAEDFHIQRLLQGCPGADSACDAAAIAAAFSRLLAAAAATGHDHVFITAYLGPGRPDLGQGFGMTVDGAGLAMHACGASKPKHALDMTSAAALVLPGRRARPGLKHTAWITQRVGLEKWRAALAPPPGIKVEEVLLHDDALGVTEGLISNLFVWRNGRLCTAPAGRVLPGQVRADVLRACADLNIPCDEEPLAPPWKDDAPWEAAFLTSAGKIIRPLTHVLRPPEPTPPPPGAPAAALRCTPYELAQTDENLRVMRQLRAHLLDVVYEGKFAEC